MGTRLIKHSILLGSCCGSRRRTRGRTIPPPEGNSWKSIKIVFKKYIFNVNYDPADWGIRVPENATIQVSESNKNSPEYPGYTRPSFIQIGICPPREWPDWNGWASKKQDLNIKSSTQTVLSQHCKFCMLCTSSGGTDWLWWWSYHPWDEYGPLDVFFVAASLPGKSNQTTHGDTSFIHLPPSQATHEYIYSGGEGFTVLRPPRSSSGMGLCRFMLLPGRENLSSGEWASALLLGCCGNSAAIKGRGLPTLYADAVVG